MTPSSLQTALVALSFVSPNGSRLHWTSMGMAEVDTASQEWLLTCLARHICRMATRADRHLFLDLMRKKHTPDFMATIEQNIRKEWAIMHPPALKTGDQHGNA